MLTFRINPVYSGGQNWGLAVRIMALTNGDKQSLGDQTYYKVEREEKVEETF